MKVWIRACFEAPRDLESLGLILWQDLVNLEESESCEGLDSKARGEGFSPEKDHNTVAGS